MKDTKKCFRQKFIYGLEGDITWYHWFDLG